MNKLRYILQSKYLIKILVFIFLIINLIYTNYYPFKSKYNSKENTFTGIITKYEVEENKIKIQIKGKEKLIINYHSTEPLNLSYGDKILVKGTLSKPNKNTNFNTFNYQKYLYNKKITPAAAAEGDGSQAVDDQHRKDGAGQNFPEILHECRCLPVLIEDQKRYEPR